MSRSVFAPTLRVLAASALFLCSMLGLQAASPAPTQADVPYGTHPRQVLDFYQAKSEQPAPVLFYVHGGGWMSGDKSNPNFLDRCLEHGISVVSVEYRLIPDAASAGIFPPVKACLEDAACALQFVRSKAGEWHLDPQRIAGCGGSAGGFTVLWLAFHPDMAQPASAQPVERESTRLCAVLAFVPQTSLDPQQMRAWIPNCEYGPHAFGLHNMAEFLAQREKLLPWIQDFSPYALVTPDDPPVLPFYDNPPKLGQEYKDPPHSANFGAALAEKLRQTGVEVEANYHGFNTEPMRYPDIFNFLAEKLQGAGRK